MQTVAAAGEADTRAAREGREIALRQLGRATGQPEHAEPEIAAQVETGLNAVKIATDGLKRYERQALASIARSKAEDPTKPTPEQLEIINGFLDERPIYETPNSRVPIGYGYKVASPILRMFQAESIGAAEFKAAHLFHRDYNLGIARQRVVGRYGVEMSMAGLGTGGTPLSQQKEDDKPEEFWRYHAKRYTDACAFINHAPTEFWLTSIACEIRVVLGDGRERVPTLEDAGRAYTGYATKAQAAAAGSTLIRLGLERIAIKYGIFDCRA